MAQHQQKIPKEQIQRHFILISFIYVLFFLSHPSHDFILSLSLSLSLTYSCLDLLNVCSKRRLVLCLFFLAEYQLHIFFSLSHSVQFLI
jgi:hypothetical protein